MTKLKRRFFTMSRLCLRMFQITVAVFISAAFLTAGLQRQASAEERLKMGYLDLNHVVQAVAKQTPEYEELRKELEKRQAEIERRGAEIDKLKEELKANRVIWSEDKSRDQEKLIRDKDDDLKVYSEGAQRFRDVEENKILRRLLPEIAKEVKRVGERDGYSMIFEKRILLYGSPSFDLTDAIIKEMSTRAD
ncbi:MAG: OmpH family outer membrane protein [Candidatus Abyssobacteria bacterium SURF_5]|uniref:OmpH family outer membrane protein n=1 Tax=Abyssobacteria bacterium (strain SURF_5) TaxID=2093360 RepID=A0A3A4NZQ1_ABYX5|nr:MAG: OmpH family outer membrane protein [Candidatus Abyssubacteria bacterium SURF_5]